VEQLQDEPVHDEPSEVDAEGGVVVMTGPADVRARFTPEAAEETAERLSTSALKARGQRYFSQSVEPKR
jgi:hypothetical protein